MKIDYNGCGGYSIGKYEVNESCNKWEIRENIDENAIEAFETFQEAVDFCIENE